MNKARRRKCIVVGLLVSAVLSLVNLAATPVTARERFSDDWNKWLEEWHKAYDEQNVDLMLKAAREADPDPDSWHRTTGYASANNFAFRRWEAAYQLPAGHVDRLEGLRQAAREFASIVGAYQNIGGTGSNATQQELERLRNQALVNLYDVSEDIEQEQRVRKDRANNGTGHQGGGREIVRKKGSEEREYVDPDDNNEARDTNQQPQSENTGGTDSPDATGDEYNRIFLEEVVIPAVQRDMDRQRARGRGGQAMAASGHAPMRRRAFSAPHTASKLTVNEIIRKKKVAQELHRRQLEEEHELDRQKELERQRELAKHKEVALQRELAKQRELAFEREIAKQKELNHQREVALQRQLAHEHEVARQKEVALQQEIAKWRAHTPPPQPRQVYRPPPQPRQVYRPPPQPRYVTYRYPCGKTVRVRVQ